MSNSKKIYLLDGAKFCSLEEFFAHVGEALIPNADWGENLDAFNDILRGGFGTPEEGFILRWQNSDLSKERLGFPETVRWLERKLLDCHPESRDAVRRDLQEALSGRGETLFEIIVSIIGFHGAGGDEQEDGVELILE